MIRIIKRGKIFLIAVFFIFLVSVVFNLVGFLENAKAKEEVNTVFSFVDNFENTKSVSFLASTLKSEQEVNKKIEVFDVKAGKVIKSLEFNQEVQDEVLQNIANISGLFVKVNALPVDGYIVRIQFDAPANINNTWVNSSNIYNVSDAFIIFPEKESPYILLFDEQKRPFFFCFEGKYDVLKAYINK